MPRALSEIAQVNPQVNLPAGAVASTPVSFVPMSDVTESGDWVGHQVRKLGEVRNGFTVFADGDVLVAKITPCFENGKGAHVVGLTNGIGFGSTEFHVLRARDGVSPRYVHHVTQSARLRRAAEAYMSGSAGQRRVPREFFDVFDVPDLSRQEQQLIGVILDTLDTTIRQTEAVIEKLKQVKQGLLLDLLTRGIDANGELRPPQSQAPHLYKDSPLGWIPREWDLLPIENLAGDVTSGARDWARFYAGSGATFVRIGNLTREHINFRFDSLVFVRPPTAGGAQRTKLHAGDILVSITADLGIIGVVPATLGEAYINQHIAMVRVNQERANPRFIGHFLSGHAAQRHIANLNDSGAKAGLNLPTIRGLPVAAPTRHEQDGIARQLDSIDLQIAAAKIELSKWTMLKSGFMDDLLTGRVRVTPLLHNRKFPVS